MVSFSFEAGTSERLPLRPNTTAPVVRSNAIAAERDTEMWGTARARASRSVSGRVLAEPVASAAGNATAAAQAKTATRPLRIGCIVRTDIGRVKRDGPCAGRR